MTAAAALWLADSGSALQHLYLIKWPGTDLKWQFCPLLAEPGNCRLRKKFGSELFIHLVDGFDSCGDKDFNFFPKMAKFQVSHWNFYIFESFGRSLSYPAQTNFLAAVNVKVDLRYEYLWAEQQTWGLSRSSESSLRVSAGGSQLWPQRDGELQIICRIKVWTHWGSQSRQQFGPGKRSRRLVHWTQTRFYFYSRVIWVVSVWAEKWVMIRPGCCWTEIKRDVTWRFHDCQ